jgi:hypothetical protein
MMSRAVKGEEEEEEETERKILAKIKSWPQRTENEAG